MHTKSILLPALAIAVICLSVTSGVLLSNSNFNDPQPPQTAAPTANPTPTSRPTPEPTAQPTLVASIGLAPPQFSLQYVDASYDVPVTRSSTIDPYTGKTIDTSTGGYHVTNRTVVLSIKNPSIDSGSSSVYFNIRYRGHYGTEWTTLYPEEIGYLLMTKGSDYTIKIFPSDSNYRTYFWGSIPSEGAPVDFQVQTMVGNASICFIELGDPWYFYGETGDWSGTQTIEIPPT